MAVREDSQAGRMKGLGEVAKSGVGEGNAVETIGLNN